MAPSRTGTAVETPMRQSCDRCHGRKLRCTRRAGGSSGACDTCLRKRAQCVYSFSLPKGRPSIYNIADKCGGASNTAATRNNSISTTNSNSNNKDDKNTIVNNTITPAPTPTNSRSREVTASLDSPQTTHMYLSGAVTPPESHIESSTESYADLLAATPGHSSGDTTTQLHNEDHQTSLLTHGHGHTHSHTTEGGLGIMADSSGPSLDGATWGGTPSSLNWGHTTPTQGTQLNSSSSSPSSYLTTTADAMDWASLGLENGSNDSRRPSVQPFSQQQIQNQELEDINNGGGGNVSMDKGSNSRGNGGDGPIVAQLSRLITRVSRLYRLSYDLASTLDPSYPMSSGSPTDVQDKMLIGETTFESVSAWLVHDSTNFINTPMPSNTGRPPQSPKQGTAGDALCHLFSASHNLLEALRQLQPNFISAPSSSTGQDTSAVGCRNTLPTPPAPLGGGGGGGAGVGGGGGGGALDSSYFPLTTTGPAATAHGHYHHNSQRNISHHHPTTPGGDDTNSAGVIRHLVVTCYTMLLNVYVSVLNTLEHDVWATRHFNGATFSDIRLASIVQLCCSLTERQYRAVDGYLTAAASTSVADNNPHQATTAIWQELMKSGGARSDPAEEEEMRFLKMEVEQRLSRLQHMLHF